MPLDYGAHGDCLRAHYRDAAFAMALVDMKAIMMREKRDSDAYAFAIYTSRRRPITAIRS